MNSWKLDRSLQYVLNCSKEGIQDISTSLPTGSWISYQKKSIHIVWSHRTHFRMAIIINIFGRGLPKIHNIVHKSGLVKEHISIDNTLKYAK